MKKIWAAFLDFEKDKSNWFLLFILFIFSALRIPSLVEPYWYGDEGIYEILGMAMRQGRLLYQGIWDNKPPMLYLIYDLFNGDQFSVRLLSLVFGALAVFLFYFLAKRLFNQKLSVFFSTLFFALFFGSPILEGNIANAENFMLFPIVFAALLLTSKKKNIKYYLLAGILLSFAFLTKIVALFDFTAFFVFLLITKVPGNFSFFSAKKYFFSVIKEKKLAKEFGGEVVLVLAFVIPILLTFVFFFLNHALSDFMKAAFSQNVGYVGYGNYLFFPMGLLVFKILILASLLLLFARYKEGLGFSGLFIFTWLSFAVFSALFSQRPYTHYLLILLPSFSLFLGYALRNKKLFNFDLVIMLFLLFILGRSFNMYEKSLSYYKNYIDFILGKKSVASYQAFFDGGTPRDYDLASFIKANTNSSDNIFLWSDSAQVYALSNKLPPGRYAVSYHITFYKDAIAETRKAIEAKKPKYIISTKDTPELQNFLQFYIYKFNIRGAKIYERQI